MRKPSQRSMGKLTEKLEIKNDRVAFSEVYGKSTEKLEINRKVRD